MGNIRQTILGISPGTRHLGYAIFRRGELVDYGVKPYFFKWRKSKLSIILNSVSKLMEQYAPDILAVKVADIESTSENVERLIVGIESEAGKNNAEIYRCALQDIKRACCDGKVNIEELHISLMKLYPELSPIEKRGLHYHEYYGKMFEAIGAVKSYLFEM